MFTVLGIKFSLLTNAIKILPDLALPTSVISLLKMLPHHMGLLTMEFHACSYQKALIFLFSL